MKLIFTAWRILCVPTLLLLPVFAQAQASNSAVSTKDDSQNSFTDGGTLLKCNDVVKITVYGEDDLTTETRIEKNGTIRFPLLGSVDLAGKTTEEATEDIRSLLAKRYIRNPQVTLTVSTHAKQSVTILGEVKNPGKVDFPEGGALDLLGAVALAGGFTDVAEISHITVRRQVSGTDAILEVDAKKLAHDNRVKPFYVRPGDTITIQQRMF